jgi:hypothetical protein
MPSANSPRPAPLLARILCPIISSRIRRSLRLFPAECPDTSALFCPRLQFVSQVLLLHSPVPRLRPGVPASSSLNFPRETASAPCADARLNESGRRSRRFSLSTISIFRSLLKAASSHLRNGSFISFIGRRYRTQKFRSDKASAPPDAAHRHCQLCIWGIRLRSAQWTSTGSRAKKSAQPHGCALLTVTMIDIVYETS